MSQKSSSLGRRVQAYPKPRYHMMFVAESKMMLRGQSEHATRIFEKYYDALEKSHQKQLMDYYDKLHQKIKPTR